jgi:E1A/CREB-binding protein
MRDRPQLALQRVYQPIFQVLWDMEFDNLGGTNPFRIIIDRNTCAAMGAPDYFDVIKTPMNLTYIKDKVKDAQYETLQAFFADVELMLNNALLYNSDPNNNYHIAAKEMKRKYKKIAKKIVLGLQKHSQRTSS